ncbi:MAG TPA: GNAT family N-acetyltransferase [Micromonosporaceae bacterium]|nr:GNAT family N-acetyltransferase [Micromonosporaceae bacterium]
MATGFVRPARPGDAEQIARIQLATWRTAYRRLLPRHVLADLDAGWMAAQWREAIDEPPSARHRVWIAVEQSGPPPTGASAEPRDPDETHAQTVGFVASGPADDEAAAPEEKPLPDTVAAVTDLLVEPRWGRRGHGSRLLAAAVEGWRMDGFESAVAWAYEEDPATRAFLASAGWEPDGATRALDVDDLLVPQLRLHVSLAIDPPE